MIASFKNEYDFLSNFYPVPITYDSLTFTCVEGAYQASKSGSLKVGRCFVNLTGAEAKKGGKLIIDIRWDWVQVKVPIMYDLIKLKFVEGTPLAQRLIDTYPHQLVEGNYWGDTFWGVCKGVGTNHLGNLLVTVRNELMGLEAPIEGYQFL